MYDRLAVVVVVGTGITESVPSIFLLLSYSADMAYVVI
jgi:hypothetical protein